MKRAVEFNTDFTIPKKTRSGAETDVYNKVITDAYYSDNVSPARYSSRTPNHPPFNRGNSTSTAVASYNNLSYNPPVPPLPPPVTAEYTVPTPDQNVELSMQQYYSNSQFATMSAAYSVLGIPKEVPKVGNSCRSTLPHNADPSLPKVLSSQFQPLYCKLCDHQLSSNTMAKLHYDSKKHNKKVRQFLIDYSEETGEPLHPKAVELSKSKNQLDKDPKFYHCTTCDLPLTGRLHAESHYMGRNHRRALAGNAPAGRGHFDSTGKWVREIALKGLPSDRADSFGLDFITTPTPVVPSVVPVVPVMPIAFPKKKDLNVDDLRCELCNVAVTSDEQMALHISGQKHRKRLNQCIGGQIIQTPLGTAVVAPNPDGNIDLSPYRTPTGNYYCEACNTTVNSEITFKQHLGSKKHKRGLINRPRQTIESQPKSKPEDKSISCDVCNVIMTSETQMKIHVSGQKHKKMCEEKGIPDELQSLYKNNGVLPNVADNQQYYKYRTPSGQYYCKRCDLTLNTEAQFKSHITGKKHWSKIQGTPNTSSK